MTADVYLPDDLVALIELYELGGEEAARAEFLDQALLERLPGRFAEHLTIESLGKKIERMVAAVDGDETVAAAARRWHKAKVTVLATGDVAARCAAAWSLTVADLADPALFEHFRLEVERSDHEVVLSYIEAFSENLEEPATSTFLDRLTAWAEQLAAASATRDLVVVLQAIGSIGVRAEPQPAAGILTRIARVAAVSLLWEPEPATVYSWERVPA